MKPKESLSSVGKGESARDYRRSQSSIENRIIPGSAEGSEQVNVH